MTENPLKIVGGVTLTPPVLGRIMMGHTEIRPAKEAGEKARALPAKDDHFTITTLVQLGDRRWEPHPIAETLEKDGGKLTAIPVRIAYNDPNLSVQNRFCCFDPETGRPLCVGDGVKARRATENGVQAIDCPRVDACEYGKRTRCKNMTRIYLQIDGQEDELGLFVLRTTSYNSLDRVAGKLNRLSGLTQGKIAGMPLLLTINSKTSAMSMRTPFWFADLVQRKDMTLMQTAKAAADWQQALDAAGLSLDGLETAARMGLANGDFADELEDVEEWLSDEDLALEAERNLQRSGLRGLDKLKAEANQGERAPAAPEGPEAGTPGVSAEATSPADTAPAPFAAPGTPRPLALGVPPAQKRAALPAVPRAA